MSTRSSRSSRLGRTTSTFLFAGALTCTVVMILADSAAWGQDGPPAGPREGGGMRGRGGGGDGGGDRPEYPPFDEVSKGFEKVVSVADGSQSLYDVWIDRKKNQLLAELPRGWQSQKYLFAVTQSTGGTFAGLQGPSAYVYWRQYDNRLALLAPELDTRSTGERETKISVERLFTDRVLLDVPIACMGPSGHPVIVLDDLLVGRASTFLGASGGGMNARLMRVMKAKAFPQNLEIAIEVPMTAAVSPRGGGGGPGGGRGGGGDTSGTLTQFHYSISAIPENTAYKPRIADERIGYFTTVYRDLGKYVDDTKWVRYIDRWQIEKRDPDLKISPPKEPIVFYIESTGPVRYRRWLRQGIEYWNNAFRKVGIDSAIEVQYQDASTGAHMDKDPEDVRYNFIRWLNNDVSTAIGPHRANPLTGQILDADVVLTDGWIRAYWGWYNEQAPEMAVEGMSAETLTWLEKYPQWDPRMLLSTPEQRQRILQKRAERNARIAAGEYVPPMNRDPAVALNDDLEQIAGWLVHDHFQCMAAHGLAMHMAFAGMTLENLGMLDEFQTPPAPPPGDTPPATPGGDKPGEKPKADKPETLDGIPEWFVGPLVADLVCHEVGHTLGLRHNFKASAIYTMAQINSNEWKGKKAIAGSVMDYIPPNFNLGAGEVQGDFGMIDIGPYDYWAIEYGYTFDDPKKVLERTSDPELVYLTDDDTGGSDPLARRYDLASDPQVYCETIIRIVQQHRSKLMEKYVKDGQSWSRARRGYERTLSMQTGALGNIANWVGGTHVTRARKGDPNSGAPLIVTDVAKQRAALQFVIDFGFKDEAFGITPELLNYMTIDKWGDQGDRGSGDSAWPVNDRIIGVQASALTQIMNPATLKRVYDNELRTPSDQDALTLPELLTKLDNSIYGELGINLDGVTFTDRKPMVSSLRRNLQSGMTDRLIILAGDDDSMPRPIRTLCMSNLRSLNSRLDTLLAKSNSGQVVAYTLAHLQDLNDRVDRALNTVQVTGITIEIPAAAPTFPRPGAGN